MYGLGRYYGGLGVPDAVCDDIMNNTAYKTVKEKKNALLLYYLHNVPMASWPSVAGALHYNEEKTASQAVKGFLKDTPAGQSSHRDYISVCIRMCACVRVCVRSFLPRPSPSSVRNAHARNLMRTEEEEGLGTRLYVRVCVRVVCVYASSDHKNVQ